MVSDTCQMGPTQWLQSIFSSDNVTDFRLLADHIQDLNGEADADMEQKLQYLPMAAWQQAKRCLSPELLPPPVALAGPETVDPTAAALEKRQGQPPLPAAAAAPAGASAAAAAVAAGIGFGASAPVDTAVLGSGACRRAFACASCPEGHCWVCLEAGAARRQMRRPTISMPSAYD